ncbi:MAG: polysaccharide deacetylase family protein [Candidatus Hodarchaeota archaeon]
MVVIILSHDVDWISVASFNGLKTFLGFVSGEFIKGSLSSMKIPRWWNFHRWMELENKYDVRSAFYFLHKGPGGSKYDFSDVNDVVKDLDKGGWEIGLHGTLNSAKNFQSLIKEKLLLEKILGKPIYGIRLHYLRISEESLKLQETAGFLYDSSLETKALFKFFHPVVNGVKLNLVELPLTLHDGTLFSKWKMTSNEACRHSRKIIERASREDGVVTLNWHQRTFSSEFGSWLKTYITILKYVKSIGAEILTPTEAVKRFQEKAL